MKSQEVKKVAKIDLRRNEPTHLTMAELFTWVVWQFPRPKGDGFCGAVHPPLANHTWYPALVLSDKEIVIVYGHLNEDFTTPNDAAQWLAQEKV